MPSKRSESATVTKVRRNGFLFLELLINSGQTKPSKTEGKNHFLCQCPNDGAPCTIAFLDRKYPLIPWSFWCFEKPGQFESLFRWQNLEKLHAFELTLYLTGISFKAHDQLELTTTRGVILSLLLISPEHRSLRKNSMLSWLKTSLPRTSWSRPDDLLLPLWWNIVKYEKWIFSIPFRRNLI